MTRLAVAVTLVAAAVVSHAATFTLVRTVPNPAPAAGDFFGSSIVASGGLILVGARFDDPAPGLANAGMAHLFDATSGARLRAFTAPSAAVGDQLGFAVATLGADLLVAAPERNGHAGAIYRFTPGAAGPVRTYATTDPGAKLGYAIAALGADVLAGAPYHGSAGGAYVFDGDSGAVRHTIANPTPDADDQFGRAVAAAGSIAAVAAPYDDAEAPNAGVVHLFAAGTGAFLRTLASPEPHAGDGFGLSLAADATRVLVGCPYGNSAYLFEAATGALLQTFASPAPDARFGAAVALEGNLVIVGAPFADRAGTDNGAGYVFDATAGTLLATLESPTPRVGAQFGGAVAMAGATVVVGAWLDDVGAADAGAAYQFVDVSAQPSTSTSSTTTSTTRTTTTTLRLNAVESTTSTTATTPGSNTTVTSTTTPATSPGSHSTTTVTTLPNSCPAATGLEVVLCRLDALDAALHATARLALGGPRLAVRLQRKIARARRLVDAARASGISPRLLRRADRTLATFIRLVDRGQRTGRIAQATADKLLLLSVDAIDELS